MQNQNTGRPYKRHIKNILIHKPMQREFSFVLIALLMVASFAVGFVIHQTIREAAFGGGFHFGKINPYQILSEVSYQIIIRVTLILFATLIVIGWYGVIFLHRVAGPVYRFKQTLSKINKGDMPKEIHLREGDFFRETAREINGVVDKVKSTREKLDELINLSSGEEMRQKAIEIKSCLVKN